MNSLGFALESRQVSPHGCFELVQARGRGALKPWITEAMQKKEAFDGARPVVQSLLCWWLEPPNEGKGLHSEAFPGPPLGSRRRPPLMLESLSQVGTNCHKVQNVLVAWGVYSLLTMAHPPWG